MAVLNIDELSETILEIATHPRSILFSGAGVGKLLGLPTWPEYLSHLAKVCTQFGDSLSAQLMEQHVAKYNYLGAAGVYESCAEIPEGERWKEMAAPFLKDFSDQELDSLKALFALPLSAVVTTNYDRGQYDAASRARGRSPLPLELDDGGLRSGSLQTNFFFARIHGRAERATSMVLTRTSYDRLATNELYKDFLLALLKQRPCLFVGFSFADPAIEHILRTYETHAGPDFQTLHTAIISADGPDSLRQKLLQLNIQVAQYDPNKSHRELWRAIRKAEADYRRAESKGRKGGAAPKSVIVAESGFKKFFAFTYAQIQTASELRPLLQQTRDGLVLSLISEAGSQGIHDDMLLNALREALQLSPDEAHKLLTDSLARLLAGNDVRRESERYFFNKTETNVLAEDLEVLVRGVMDRFKVREGAKPELVDFDRTREGLERILIVRAWDVAAHYAGGGTGYGADLSDVVNRIISDLNRDQSSDRAEKLQRSVLDLLISPTDAEAERLAELGRTAFALQLVLASPRQTTLHRFVLPSLVYFDSNVLLPTLVPGHPSRQLFLDAIKRLREAARTAGITCDLAIGRPFLNEVIAHRAIAKRTVNGLSLNDPVKLRRFVALHGRREDINVFIGAFATHVGRALTLGEERPTFQKFIATAAPFETEEALAFYLSQQGFKIVTMDFRAEHNIPFSHILNPLSLAYEQQEPHALNSKQTILVEHEAQQLTQLHLDQAAGIRAIFVSADRTFYRAVLQSAELHYLAAATLSVEGFLGLVDLMVGLKTDNRALARLVWAAPRRGVDQVIRDYLVKRALDEMDVAYAKAMPDLIDDLVAEGKKDIKKHDLDLFSGEVDEMARSAQMMDRLEDKFFAKMRRAIEQQEKA